jgi:hypothetical protein
MFDFFKEHDMAAKKRKPTRTVAKKAVKKNHRPSPKETNGKKQIL